MLMPILQEMWDIVLRVFGSADTISLVIMLVVVVASGMVLGRVGRIIQVTVGALIMFGLIRLAYTVTQGAEPTALPSTAWNGLKVMSVGDLTVYFLAFAIVITVVHIIRSSVGSGDGGGGHGHH
ncbi:MAG: hypothetical protein KBA31_11240 [Alphaproteobacteria bacterium]|nr:hypothetical protein [Alphaproteobacteria bacterium]